MGDLRQDRGGPARAGRTPAVPYGRRSPPARRRVLARHDAHGPGAPRRGPGRDDGGTRRRAAGRGLRLPGPGRRARPLRHRRARRVPLLRPGIATPGHGARTVRVLPGVRRRVRRGPRAPRHRGRRRLGRTAPYRRRPARTFRGRGGAVPAPGIMGDPGGLRGRSLRGRDRRRTRGRGAVARRRREAGVRPGSPHAGVARRMER